MAKSTMSRSHQVATDASVPPRSSYRPPEEPLPYNPHNIALINGPLKFDERRNMYYHGKSLDEMKNDDVKAGGKEVHHTNKTFWNNICDCMMNVCERICKIIEYPLKK